MKLVESNVYGELHWIVRVDDLDLLLFRFSRADALGICGHAQNRGLSLVQGTP